MVPKGFRVIQITLFLLLFINCYASEDIVEKYEDGIINWTKGTLEAEAEIPALNFDTDFGKSFILYERKMKEILVTKMYKLISKLRVDSLHLVEELYIVRPELKNEILSFIDNSEFSPTRYWENRLHQKAKIYIYGPKGLMKFFRETYFLPEYKKFVGNYEPKRFTGLVIDARYTELNPALKINIYTEKGDLVFTPSLMDFQLIETKGIVKYISSPFDLDTITNRCGNMIFYTLPAESKGRNKSDIVLFEADVIRLLADEMNIDIFRNGNIIVILRDRR